MTNARPSRGQDAIPAAILDQIAPAVINKVVAEDHLLQPQDVVGWRPEKGPAQVRSSSRGVAGALVPGALDLDSLIVRCEGVEWTEGREFVVDPFWGSLSKGSVITTAGHDDPVRLTESEPDGSSASAVMVHLSYSWSVRRIDAISRDRAGGWRVWPGVDHLSAPVPPAVAEDHQIIAYVYVDHFDQAGQVLRRHPMNGPVSAAQLDRLPHVQAVRAQGEAVRIACWGDSVTAGGDATTSSNAFPGLLQSGLTRAWGAAGVNLQIVAVGGSSTSDWLASGEGSRDRSGQARLPGTDLHQLLEFRPDVVVTEFVNDASLTPDAWQRNYGHIRELCHDIGADLILTTPHFTAASWMGDADLETGDQRPVTTFLRQFAHRHQIALADVSRRWERLYTEGIPYPTLLNNGVNHPDDRGHQLAAEEIAAVLGVAL